jgi:hypothetical protein
MLDRSKFRLANAVRSTRGQVQRLLQNAGVPPDAALELLLRAAESLDEAEKDPEGRFFRAVQRVLRESETWGAPGQARTREWVDALIEGGLLPATERRAQLGLWGVRRS